MNNHVPIPVVLCGGEGSRLWPLSRAHLPKPYVALADGETLLQKTARRIAARKGIEKAVVIANAQHLYPTMEQLQALDGLPVELVLEPQPKDTGPAVALAIARLAHTGIDQDRFILITPADHLITPDTLFWQDVESVMAASDTDSLHLFGIPPQHPHTGFGYIIPEKEGVRFVEKPDRARAEQLIAAGALWNSGMFLATLGHFVQLLETLAPALWQWAQRVMTAPRIEQVRNHTLVTPEQTLFDDVSPVSFDVAVVERAAGLSAHPVRFQWSDVGSWAALFEQLPRDERGNGVFQEDASSEVRLNESENVSVWAEGERMVAVNGVRDLLVVDMPDVVLISHPEANASLKALYRELSRQNHPAAKESAVVSRPWGQYIVLHAMPGYKVKKIMVEPGQRLSYQSHRHRHEHWVVTRGQARVLLEGVAHQLNVNDAIYIPAGAKHRLANDTAEMLEIIEVQIGDYLGEDDIERFEDDYLR